MITHPWELAGTYRDGCHADVVQSRRNGGVAVWDCIGKHARKRGENSMWLDSVPKRQSTDVGLHVQGGSRDFGVIPSEGITNWE